MALYPISTSDRMEPLDEDPTPAEVMEGCAHADACRRVLEMLDGPVNDESFAWMDDLAARLGCATCEEVG